MCAIAASIDQCGNACKVSPAPGSIDVCDNDAGDLPPLARYGTLTLYIYPLRTNLLYIVNDWQIVANGSRHGILSLQIKALCSATHLPLT